MLRPDVSRPLLYAWGSFAAVVLLGGLALAWYSDDGGLSKRLEQADRDHQQREGGSEVLLEREVTEQRRENRQLSETIGHIKEQVGIAPIEPYIVPKRYAGQRRFYFNMIFEATRKILYDRAVRRRMKSYDSELGYGSKAVADGEVAQELIRLQLIAKAMMLALSTEGDLEAIDVLHGPIEQTGPSDRPPLMMEYSFSLQVQGALKDVLWLLHQLGVEEPDEAIERGLNALFMGVQRATEVPVEPLDQDDFFPLIVRGLQIRSSNVSARDKVTMLEVTIDIAGMEFLSQEERAKGGRTRSTESGGSARLPGRGRSRRAR